MDVGEVGAHECQVLVVGHDVRLGDYQVADVVLVQFLDGLVGRPVLTFEGLEAVGHAAEPYHIAFVKVAGNRAVYLLDVHHCGLSRVP